MSHFTEYISPILLFLLLSFGVRRIRMILLDQDAHVLAVCFWRVREFHPGLFQVEYFYEGVWRASKVHPLRGSFSCPERAIETCEEFRLTLKRLCHDAHVWRSTAPTILRID